MSVILELAAGAASNAPTRLDPVELFLDADIVVQLVMAGLALASIWCWALIIAFAIRMRNVKKGSAEFELEFWQAEDFEAIRNAKGKGASPSARVAHAGMSEWNRSTKKGVRDKDGVRSRLVTALESQVATEADDLGAKLNFLATTGSVAPFVGLFGTVWGIMNSFFQIGAQQNSSLAVVAPGISEALFATAIGLFAAIPAVIAYNRYSNSVNLFEAKLQRFADRLHGALSRQLELM